MRFFPSLTIDQILFTLTMPLRGSNFEIAASALVFLAVIPVSTALANYIMLKSKKYVYVSSNSALKLKILPFTFRYCKTVLFFFFAVLFSFIFFKLDLTTFIKYALKENSTFYEEHYIDPGKLNFIFPVQKKNLILIYLESVEADAAKYAAKNANIMPELTKIAHENISFSNSEELGGQDQVYGTGWALASLCCTTLGIPLTLPIGGNSYQYTKHFFNGAYGLGDLLRDNGYNLSFLMGADSEFGGLRSLLATHGISNIKSLEYFILCGGELKIKKSLNFQKKNCFL